VRTDRKTCVRSIRDNASAARDRGDAPPSKHHVDGEAHVCDAAFNSHMLVFSLCYAAWTVE
jgi:hypothetical protein